MFQSCNVWSVCKSQCLQKPRTKIPACPWPGAWESGNPEIRPFGIPGMKNLKYPDTKYSDIREVSSTPTNLGYFDLFNLRRENKVIFRLL